MERSVKGFLLYFKVEIYYNIMVTGKDLKARL